MAVRSVLAQDVAAEVIVVNSGGSAPHQSLAEAGLDLKVVHREEILYPGAARNLGIQETTAPFVSFLAADCLAEPGWVAGRVRRHRSGAEAVSSAVTNANPRNPAAIASQVLLFATRLPGAPDRLWNHYGVSYARELFTRFGPFREDLRTGEDTEFHDRIAGHVSLVDARDVKSQHRHPIALGSLCRDQLRRGRLLVRTVTKLTGEKPPDQQIQVSAIPDLRSKIASYWASVSCFQRMGLVLALPWIFIAWLFYRRGTLSPASEAATSDQSQSHRIHALLTFHNAMDYLPGYFENVAPQVDGIIALDDGSTDGSAEFVSRQENVVALLRKEPQDSHVWNENENQRMLIEAAAEIDPDWLLAVDADERLERHFRIRALGAIGRATRLGWLALSITLRELWDEPDLYRVDGIWGTKRRARLFKYRPDHQFDEAALHNQWAPVNSKSGDQYPPADLIIYHLKMIDPEERQARQELYEQLDPDCRWQPMGYEYLTDETTKILESLPPGRDYIPRFV